MAFPLSWPSTASPQDTEAELKLIEDKCKALGVNVALSEVWGKGGAGGKELAEEVVRLCEEPNNFDYCYPAEMGLKDKIKAIVTKIYRGDGVDFAPAASREIRKLEEMGFGSLPVCMAKTQYSFSDDQKKLGAPENFRITVRSVKVSAGAGLCCRSYGRYHDHARPAQSTLGRENRYR